MLQPQGTSQAGVNGAGGGGAQGAAIAYKLALAGWGEDVVLIEQVKINN